MVNQYSKVENGLERIEFKVNIAAGINLVFVEVKGGEFQMGDVFGDGEENEKPVHVVRVSDFSMGKTEITVGQFKVFIDETGYKTDAENSGGAFGFEKGTLVNPPNSQLNWRSPGFPQTDAHPVTCVSHNDAVAFAEWLEKKSGKMFRLPTEAEWEYAARSGGKKVKYSWGDASPCGNVGDESFRRDRPKDIDWFIFDGYDDGYGMGTAPVASFEPNGLGLFDMTGNVWEWCGDWYGENYYASSPTDDPKGPLTGGKRVLRGGAWITGPKNARVFYRLGDMPAARTYKAGFRLAISVCD